MRHLSRRTDHQNACRGKPVRRSPSANSLISPRCHRVSSLARPASRDKTSRLSREISTVASEISWRDFRSIPPRPRASRRKHAEEPGERKTSKRSLGWVSGYRNCNAASKLSGVSTSVARLMICVIMNHCYLHTHTHTLSLSLSLSFSEISALNHV